MLREDVELERWRVSSAVITALGFAVKNELLDVRPYKKLIVQCLTDGHWVVRKAAVAALSTVLGVLLGACCSELASPVQTRVAARACCHLGSTRRRLSRSSVLGF